MKVRGVDDTAVDVDRTREAPRRRRAWMITVGAPVLGVLVGLLIGALLILLAGADPIGAYGAMLAGAFGGRRQIEETILKATPLLLMGLGLTAAFRARVWNIGGEGQFYMGALAGGAVALTFGGQWSRPVLIIGMLLAGVIGGGLWAACRVAEDQARYQRDHRHAHVELYRDSLHGVRGTRPLQEPGGYLPESAQFVAAARMPLVIGSRIHIGTLIALIMVPVVYLLLWSTPLGFRLRAAGSRAV